MGEKTLFCLVIIIFLILSLQNIDKPGLNIDEADDAIACDSIFQDNPVFRKELSASYFITLFNKSIPIMHGPYTGRIQAYIMFILSRVLGLNIFSIRFAPVFMSAITLLFVYLFCKMWFNYRPAIISILLTATNLFFVQYSRVGNYREEIFIISFFWIGFYFLFRFLKERRIRFIFISFFIFGLGLSTKITMLFYLIGLGASFMILNKEFHPFYKIRFKYIVLALVGFCIGSINLVLFNIIYNGKSFKVLSNSLKYPSFYGYNNLDYFGNLRMRVSDLMALLKSHIFESADWGITHRYFIENITPLLIGLFVVSFMFLAVFFLRNTNKTLKYKIAFLFILYGTTFLLTPFTPVGAHPGHLLLLLPFPQITIALFLDYIWVRLKNNKIALGIVIVFIFPFLIFHILMNMHFYKEMENNGGYKRWSTAIYELSSYLEREKIHSPVIFGFGLKENISFLTRYRVIPDQLEENRSLEDTNEVYKRISSNKRPIFFLTKNTEDYKPNLDFFMELAEKDGKNKELYKVFYNRAGEPVYWLYKIN